MFSNRVETFFFPSYRGFVPSEHPAMQAFMRDKAEEQDDFEDIEAGATGGGGFSFDMKEDL